MKLLSRSQGVRMIAYLAVIAFVTAMIGANGQQHGDEPVEIVGAMALTTVTLALFVWAMERRR